MGAAFACMSGWPPVIHSCCCCCCCCCRCCWRCCCCMCSHFLAWSKHGEWNDEGCDDGGDGLCACNGSTTPTADMAPPRPRSHAHLPHAKSDRICCFFVLFGQRFALHAGDCAGYAEIENPVTSAPAKEKR